MVKPSPVSRRVQHDAQHQSAFDRGHLWQERFHSFAMDDAHLWMAMRYIERNPARAGLVRGSGRMALVERGGAFARQA